MITTEKAPVPGTIIWTRTESLARVKFMLYLISAIMFAIAIEAIRVALIAGITGITPLAFGVMPTRQLAGIDIPIAVSIALVGIAYVGYRLIRVIFEGLPLAMGLIAATETQVSGLVVAWDGVLKPQRFYPFGQITEIDSIARGTMGSGGHQVRIRVQGRLIAVTVARFDTAAEADQLVAKLIAQRERALGEDRDLRGE